MPQAQHETDGLLVTAREADGIVRIQAMGPYRDLAPQFPDLPVTQWSGLCIAPGFVDLHIHYPQTDVIGSPADGLLPWLEHYTFPHEKQFSEPAYAHEVTAFFMDELMRHGVTTALCFATAHPESVDVFMAEAQKRRLRMVTGKVLQDRHSPDGLRDTDTALSLRQTEELIRRWQDVDRLGYAITPRFAPTSTPGQLAMAGRFMAEVPGLYMQTHVAENRAEVAWVAELFPEARSYLDVYARHGLLGPRAVLAHGIWLDEADRYMPQDHLTGLALLPLILSVRAGERSPARIQRRAAPTLERWLARLLEVTPSCAACAACPCRPGRRISRRSPRGSSPASSASSASSV